MSLQLLQNFKHKIFVFSSPKNRENQDFFRLPNVFALFSTCIELPFLTQWVVKSILLIAALSFRFIDIFHLTQG